MSSDHEPQHDTHPPSTARSEPALRREPSSEHASPSVAAAARSAGKISCSACGAHYCAAAWRELALSRRMTPDDVRHHVLGWPEEQCVEVRACRCGNLIATRQPTTGAAR